MNGNRKCYLTSKTSTSKQRWLTFSGISYIIIKQDRVYIFRVLLEIYKSGREWKIAVFLFRFRNRYFRMTPSKITWSDHMTARHVRFVLAEVRAEPDDCEAGWQKYLSIWDTEIGIKISLSIKQDEEMHDHQPSHRRCPGILVSCDRDCAILWIGQNYSQHRWRGMYCMCLKIR